MGFRMFSNPAMPIAMNFGCTSVKLLQRAAGEGLSLQAAAELPLPLDIQQSPDALFDLYNRELPKLLRDGRFRGKRVLCSVPTHQTIVQHMQLPQQEGIKRDEQVKTQLQMQMGIAPGSAVVRSVEVTDLNRAGQSRTEIICFAIPRDVVMRYVSLLERHKLEVIGVHTEAMAMVRAFDHIHQRKGDENLTTMYIDLGYTGTRVAVAHGTQIAFARSIQVGGRHFDELIANELSCDQADAMAHRLAMQDPCEAPRRTAAPQTQTGAAAMPALSASMAKHEATEPGQQSSVSVVAGERRSGQQPAAIAQSVAPGDGTPAKAANVDFTELLDTISDEISMCLRYHNGLFPDRSIDRAILVGGEARQHWLCRHVVRALRLPAQLGDPLAAFKPSEENINTPGLDRTQPQPGWTVACGLSAAPAGG